MFNQVKCYDKNGKLIQVIPPEKLSSYHWTDFHKSKKPGQGPKSEPMVINIEEEEVE